nr:IPT/TIG domain-containing protein [Micromonospora sp. DSM 115978]
MALPVPMAVPAGARVVPAGAVAGVGHPRPPVVDGIEPAGGPKAGGTTVAVTGAHFLPGRTRVRVCGRTIPADAVAVKSGGRSLTFTSPSCPGRNAMVTVSTAGGRSAGIVFAYLGAPAPVAGGAVWAQLAVGLALVFGGVLLLAVYRRPRRRSECIGRDKWSGRDDPDQAGRFARRPG